MTYIITGAEDVDNAVTAICNGITFRCVGSRKHPTYYFMCGAGFDIETTKINDHAAYCYVWQAHINNVFVYGRYLETMQIFFEHLDNALETASKQWHDGNRVKDTSRVKLLVWDANLGYEWAFCKRYWAHMVGDVFAKTERRPLSINIGRHIQMRECIGLFGYSLQNIAENWTDTQKATGDLDYSKPRHSETPLDVMEMNYIYNDVKILDELGSRVIPEFVGRGQTIPLTHTGIIRNNVKQRIGGRWLYLERKRVREQLPLTETDYTILVNNVYWGGLSHSRAASCGIVLLNVRCADLTSDFPAQMNHHNFPKGKLLENITVSEMCKYTHYYALFTFRNVKQKTGHSYVSRNKCVDYDNLAIWDNGRLWATEGSISIYLTEIDFSNFCKFYDFDENALDISDCHAWETTGKLPRHLLDEMNENYKLKNSLKRAGKTDTREYVESKKIVNGCYGMTATKIYTDTTIFDGNEITMTKSNDDFEKLVSKLFLSPVIAIYTTAYARQILTYFITKYSDVIVQYDTDSLYFTDDGSEQANALKREIEKYNKYIEQKNAKIFNGDPDFSDLGAWDMDEPCTRFKCLGAKRYLKEYIKNGEKKIKPTIAGCNVSAFVEFFEKHPEDDPFDAFYDRFRLDAGESHKTTLKYIDREKTCKITDYCGNTQTVHIPSCGVICDIPFQLFMGYDFLQHIANLREIERKVRI